MAARALLRTPISSPTTPGSIFGGGGVAGSHVLLCTRVRPLAVSPVQAARTFSSLSSFSSPLSSRPPSSFALSSLRPSSGVLIPVAHATSFHQRKTAHMKKQLGTMKKQKIEIPQPKIDASMVPGVKSGTGIVADDWIPLEGSALPSWFDAEGFRYRLRALKKNCVSTLAVAYVRYHLKGFSPIPFAEEMQAMYIEARKASTTWDKATMRKLFTSDGLELFRSELKTPARWSLVSVKERPRIVHLAFFPFDTEKNFYAQVAVKMVLERETNEDGLLKVKEEPEYLLVERHIVQPSSTWQIVKTLPPLSMPELMKKKPYSYVHPQSKNLAVRIKQ